MQLCPATLAAVDLAFVAPASLVPDTHVRDAKLYAWAAVQGDARVLGIEVCRDALGRAFVCVEWWPDNMPNLREQAAFLASFAAAFPA